MTRRKVDPKWIDGRGKVASILSRDFPNSVGRGCEPRKKFFALVYSRDSTMQIVAIVRSVEEFVIEHVPSGGVADDGGGLPPFQLSLVLHSRWKIAIRPVDSATGSRLSMLPPSRRKMLLIYGSKACRFSDKTFLFLFRFDPKFSRRYKRVLIFLKNNRSIKKGRSINLNSMESKSIFDYRFQVNFLISFHVKISPKWINFSLRITIGRKLRETLEGGI